MNSGLCKVMVVVSVVDRGFVYEQTASKFSFFFFSPYSLSGWFCWLGCCECCRCISVTALFSIRLAVVLSGVQIHCWQCTFL